MNVSQYAKATGKTKQEVMDQFSLTHHLQSVPDEASSAIEVPVQEIVQEEVITEDPVQQVKKPEEPKQVVFYWRNGQNVTFSIQGPIVGGVQQNGEFYKSEKSVLRLDTVRDAKAIAKLRAMAGHEKNGGKDFGEMAKENFAKVGEGHAIDKLMEMSVATLAEMTGGGFAATLKSKGTLIAEIMKMNG